MPRSSLPLSLLATGWLACAGSCTSDSGSDSDTKHRPVGKIATPIAAKPVLRSLEIVNVAGTVEVRPADETGASIEVEVLLSEDRPQSDFDPDFAKHIEVVRNGDSLKLSNRHAGQNDSNDWQLRFVVRVPAGISLNIAQVAGKVDARLPRADDVTIENIAGSTELVIPTIEGSVAVTQKTGQIAVTITDHGPTGGSQLECTAGTIALTLPEDVNGEFDLSAFTGDLDIDKRFGLIKEREMTRVTAIGRVGNGGARFRAHVVTGTVDLK